MRGGGMWPPSSNAGSAIEGRGWMYFKIILFICIHLKDTFLSYIYMDVALII